MNVVAAVVAITLTLGAVTAAARAAVSLRLRYWKHRRSAAQGRVAVATAEQILADARLWDAIVAIATDNPEGGATT
jgi:hypothetical protein